LILNFVCTKVCRTIALFFNEVFKKERGEKDFIIAVLCKPRVKIMLLRMAEIQV
jgi:hypothetical protein